MSSSIVKVVGSCPPVGGIADETPETVAPELAPRCRCADAAPRLVSMPPRRRATSSWPVPRCPAFIGSETARSISQKPLGVTIRRPSPRSGGEEVLVAGHQYVSFPDERSGDYPSFRIDLRPSHWLDRRHDIRVLLNEPDDLVDTCGWHVERVGKSPVEFCENRFADEQPVLDEHKLRMSRQNPRVAKPRPGHWCPAVSSRDFVEDILIGQPALGLGERHATAPQLFEPRDGQFPRGVVGQARGRTACISSASVRGEPEDERRRRASILGMSDPGACRQDG